MASSQQDPDPFISQWFGSAPNATDLQHCIKVIKKSKGGEYH